MSSFPNSLDALKPNMQFSHTLVVKEISLFLTSETVDGIKYVDFNFQNGPYKYSFRTPLNTGRANVLKDFFEALSSPGLIKADLGLKNKQDYFKELGNDPADWASACIEMAKNQNIRLDENYLTIWLEHALEHSSDNQEPKGFPDSRGKTESGMYLDSLDDTFIANLATPIGFKDVQERPLQVGDRVIVGQVKYPAIIKKIGACTADIRRTDNGDYWTVHLSDISLDKNRQD